MVTAEAINATINATVNASLMPVTFWDRAVDIYIPLIKERTLALVLAPHGNPEMLWIVFPLLVSLVFMTLYFGRYRKEELGWNTAFGNSLALLFVAVDLFRQIAKQPSNFELLQQGILSSRVLVPIIISLFAIFLLVSNFFHILPKFFAFFISSALPINFLAYVGIVVVYTGFRFDWFTLIAAGILYILLLILFAIIHHFEPQDWEEKQQDMIDQMMHKNEHRHERYHNEGDHQ
ncbi:hypothetical protein ACFL96_11735 [Thermoproteota archaeon]